MDATIGLVVIVLVLLEAFDNWRRRNVKIIKRKWRKFKVFVIGRVLYRCGLIRRTTIFRWEVDQCIGD